MNHHKPDQVMQEVEESYRQIYNIRSYALINVNFVCGVRKGGPSGASALHIDAAAFLLRWPIIKY